MALEVKALDGAGVKQWDEYVQRTPDATFFTGRVGGACWKRPFGIEPISCTLSVMGRLSVILPLAEIKRPFWSLVVLPPVLCLWRNCC